MPFGINIFIAPEGLPAGIGGDLQVLSLGFVYSYLLFCASQMISDGAELLLLVPRFAGVVGSIVLPLLGAMPDAAIVLFSGMGDNAAEEVKVGLGTLAGSTVMLLTMPWAAAIWSGKVRPDQLGNPDYSKKNGPLEGRPGVVGNTSIVKRSGQLMMLTSVSYLIVQIPSIIVPLIGLTDHQAVPFERKFVLAAIVSCAFFTYYYIKKSLSHDNMGQIIQVESRKTKMVLRLLSSQGATLRQIVRVYLAGANIDLNTCHSPGKALDALRSSLLGDATVMALTRPITDEIFMACDEDGDGKLSIVEIKFLIQMLNRVPVESQMVPMFLDKPMDLTRSNMSPRFAARCAAAIDSDYDRIFRQFDADGSGYLDKNEFNSFIVLYSIYEDKSAEDVERGEFSEGEFEASIAHLTHSDQEKLITNRAQVLLALGTSIVLIFSSPMCDTLNEVGRRVGIDPFYLAFIFAPLASNAAEAIASVGLASKKSQASIEVSFTALTGAGSMNNTVCLGVFLFIVYWKELPWEYAPEVISILCIEYMMGWYAQSPKFSTHDAIIIASMYPISILIVAALRLLLS